MKNNQETFNSIKTEMPFSIRKAAAALHEHFIKFLGVQDLDQQTKMNIKMMFTAEQKLMNNTVAEESSDDSLMTDEDIEYERTISPEQKIDHMLSNIHCASPTKL